MDKLKFTDMWVLLTQDLTQEQKQWIFDNMSVEEIMSLFVKITKQRIR